MSDQIIETLTSGDCLATFSEAVSTFTLGLRGQDVLLDLVNELANLASTRTEAAGLERIQDL